MSSTTQSTIDTEFITKLKQDPLLTVAMFYTGCLAASAKAVAFVTDELGLTMEQAIEQRIGFSDRTLGKAFPSKRVKLGKEIREMLETVGIFKANGRETLRGYITVPVFNDAGEVIGIRGHQLDKRASGPETVLVGESREQVSGNGPQEETAKDENQASGFANDANEESALVVDANEITFVRDDRRYRIRGLEKNSSLLQLKVNVFVSRENLVHLDTLDLAKARSRAGFIKAAATELYVDADIIKKDIGILLGKLEAFNSERINELKNPKSVQVTLSEEEQHAALELLQSPNLLERVVADMDACGMVGESNNKLAGYLAATSRKLSTPLAVVIQSSSSAGKTSLMDAVLSMMPAEEVNRFSGMTGQSLFYLDSTQIKHKILAIAEDEGIKEATYALKLLQSEGELRHATVGRGEDGRAQTQEHHVEGPVQIFLTTTAMEIDEELVNRCLVLSVDESNRQTGAIQAMQRQAFTADIAQSSFVADALRKLHQNAQRLLQPVGVYNPFAPQLTFPHHKTRMRRDHVKYLTLINTIAFLHQHQRKLEVRAVNGETFKFINVERQDIAVANGLAGEVLGRSLDELSPQTRNLIGLMHTHVASEVKSLRVPRDAYRFTRRDLREAIGWSDFQVRSHLKKLVELEYVIVHRGRNGQRYVYELLYNGEGREGQPFFMGLIDPSKLQEPATMVQTPSIPLPTLSIGKPSSSPA